MKASPDSTFNQDYQTLLKHLHLKGLQPKTIDAYSRAIRYFGEWFDYQLRDLSEAQLLDYFLQPAENPFMEHSETGSVWA